MVEDLLADLFSVEELRRWLARYGLLDAGDIRTGPTTANEEAPQVVEALGRRGRLKAAFFDAMKTERPDRSGEIELVEVAVLKQDMEPLGTSTLSIRGWDGDHHLFHGETEVGSWHRPADDITSGGWDDRVAWALALNQLWSTLRLRAGTSPHLRLLCDDPEVMALPWTEAGRRNLRRVSVSRRNAEGHRPELTPDATALVIGWRPEEGSGECWRRSLRALRERSSGITFSDTLAESVAELQGLAGDFGMQVLSRGSSSTSTMLPQVVVVRSVVMKQAELETFIDRFTPRVLVYVTPDGVPGWQIRAARLHLLGPVVVGVGEDLDLGTGTLVAGLCGLDPPDKGWPNKWTIAHTLVHRLWTEGAIDPMEFDGDHRPRFYGEVGFTGATGRRLEHRLVLLASEGLLTRPGIVQDIRRRARRRGGQGPLALVAWGPPGAMLGWLRDVLRDDGVRVHWSREAGEESVSGSATAVDELANWALPLVQDLGQGEQVVLLVETTHPDRVRRLLQELGGRCEVQQLQEVPVLDSAELDDALHHRGVEGPDLRQAAAMMLAERIEWSQLEEDLKLLRKDKVAFLLEVDLWRARRAAMEPR